jgi:hypothetical protein
MTVSLAYGGPWVEPWCNHDPVAVRNGVCECGVQVEQFIDLEKVAEFVTAELPDVRCYVEQTGGGVATIYLGPEYCVDKEGRVVCWPTQYAQYCDSGHDVYIPVMGGPGHFQGPHWTEGRSYPEEFVGNWDLDLVYGPNDVAPYSGERVIARRMIQLYRDHPRVKAGEVR